MSDQPIMKFFFSLKSGIYESILLESRYKMYLRVGFCLLLLRDCLPGTLDPQSLPHNILEEERPASCLGSKRLLTTAVGVWYCENFSSSSCYWAKNI